jgi:hypothetical protein
MRRRVELVLGSGKYRREVEIGDLATPAHVVERGRQELLDERDLDDVRFLRGRVLR